MSTNKTNLSLSAGPSNDSSSDDSLSLTLGNPQKHPRLNPESIAKDISSDDFLSLSLPDHEANLENSRKAVFDPLCPTSIKRNKEDLEAMATKLDLPESVKNQAYQNFKKVEEEERGKRRNVLYAACIYIACRQNDIALSLEEIQSVADGAIASRIYNKAKSLAPSLGLGPEMLMHIRVDEFTKRFCSVLQIDGKIAETVHATAENAAKFVTKRTPLAVAATVIYVVARLNFEKKLFKDILEATGLAEGTITETYRDWYPHLGKSIPKEFADSKDIKKLHRPY